MVFLEKEEKAETLSNMWMGSNLEYKGIEGVLASIRGTAYTKEEPTVEQVKNDWRRLASFMSGRK